MRGTVPNALFAPRGGLLEPPTPFSCSSHPRETPGAPSLCPPQLPTHFPCSNCHSFTGFSALVRSKTWLMLVCLVGWVRTLRNPLQHPQKSPTSPLGPKSIKTQVGPFWASVPCAVGSHMSHLPSGLPPGGPALHPKLTLCGSAEGGPGTEVAP